MKMAIMNATYSLILSYRKLEASEKVGQGI